ncbi:MAG TPA: hypothetical protein VGL72_16280 [Bryobacteraceae bacterium]
MSPRSRQPARPASSRGTRPSRSAAAQRPSNSLVPAVLFATILVWAFVWWFTNHYTINFQSPITIRFQSPIVIAERLSSEDAEEARADQQGRRLTAWQQYTCRKFGSECRVALAIQRAENPQGKCEIYHYNTDGTLDWGYFQINTVHLKRPGLNLRDLLDCKANIDFAYQLFQESHGFTPWSTYNNGRYRQFLRSQ